MKRRAVDKQAIKRTAIQSTKDSAQLAGRIIPADFVRSQRVEQFFAERHRNS